MGVAEIHGVNFATGFSWDTTDATPWTRYDVVDELNGIANGLIAGFNIRRGRQDELGRIGAGTCTIETNDRDGVFNPTVSIAPRTPVAIGLHNPVLDTWHTVFRGITESQENKVDRSQRIQDCTVECTDLFDVLAGIEVAPGGAFGQSPPRGSEGDIFYEDASPGPQVRIEGVLDEAGVPAAFYQINTGNVSIQETVYPPGTDVLSICQEAADAEFPGLGLFFCNREGVIRFTGRQVRFRPEVVEYDVDIWKAGDGAAVLADGTGHTAHIRGLNYLESRAWIINAAMATPQIQAADAEKEYADNVDLNIITDPTSIDTYGVCPWQAENLLTDGGISSGNDKWEETRVFATYYRDHYAYSLPRVNQVVFRSIRPTEPGAEWTWRVICEVDINDIIRLTCALPGGGSFTEEDYFVEGITYDVGPLGDADYADVTLTLDVTPRAYYTSNPFDSDPDPT